MDIENFEKLLNYFNERSIPMEGDYAHLSRVVPLHEIESVLNMLRKGTFEDYLKKYKSLNIKNDT
jgi:hypothetical protein